MPLLRVYRLVIHLSGKLLIYARFTPSYLIGSSIDKETLSFVIHKFHLLGNTFLLVWFWTDIVSVSYQFSSVTQSCPTTCNPTNCSKPGFSVPHQHPELAQTHVNWVSDYIQSSHPLSSPSPPFNLSQHQGPFQWVTSSHQVANVLEFQPQRHSFQWILRTDFLKDWPVWSPCSPRDSQESFSTPQFKSVNSKALSLLYGPTLTYTWVYFSHIYWKNHSFDYRDLCE